MSEENSNNQNNNTATNIIIWLAGIMVLVVGGVYLLGESEENFNKKKAECRKSFRMEMLAFKYGSLSYEYSKLLDACAKKGVYGFDTEEVLGE